MNGDNEFPAMLEIDSPKGKSTFRLISHGMHDDTSYQPEYEQDGSGLKALATGLVFVRMQDGNALDDAALADRGYRIVDRFPGLSPAGWVGAVNGNHAAALRNFACLWTIDGVIHVEPQLIMQAVRK